MSTHSEIKTINVIQLIKLIALTLLVGIILNSSSLYIKATTWDDGLTKTVAVNILKPISVATKAFGINLLRGKSREAIGMKRDDKIDNFEFKKTMEELKVPVPSSTIPKLTPENKLTTWIIGDSLATIPGESLLNNLGTSFDVYGLDSRVSTGFSRSDIFNWASNIQDFVTTRKPQAIIISIGANDDQSIFVDGNPIGPFGTDAWKQAYLTRINATLDFLAENNVHTLWVEIPPVRDPERGRRYDVINALTKTAIDAHPNTSTLVEIRAAFTDSDNTYRDSLPINGQETLLRAPDGIHFTRAGGDLIASLVIKKLHSLYRF